MHQLFKFDVIRFTGYGVIAEKPRVGQLGRIFPCNPRKNYALDRKMNDTYFNAHDELYHHAKFGKTAQCAPAVGAKMWTVVFVFYRQDAAKRQTPGIKFTHRPKNHVFRPAGATRCTDSRQT